MPKNTSDFSQENNSKCMKLNYKPDDNNIIFNEANELYLCLVYFANKLKLKIQPIKELPPDNDIDLFISSLCEMLGLHVRKINLSPNLTHIDLSGTIVFKKDTKKAYMVESSFWGKSHILDVKTWKTYPMLLNELEPYGYFIYRPLIQNKLRISDIIKTMLILSKKDFFGFITFLLFFNFITLSIPVLTGLVLDWAVPYADYSLLTQIFLSLILAASLLYIVSLGQTNIFSRIKSRSTIYGQLGIWGRVLSLPLDFFRRYEVGDLSLRIKGLDHINQEISFSIITFLSGIIYTIIGLIIISFFSITYSMIIFFVGLIGGILFFYTSYKQLIFSRKAQHYQAKIQSLLYQSIINIHKIKIAKAESKVNEGWLQFFLNKLNFVVKAKVFSIIFQTLSSLLLLSLMMIIYVFVFQSKDLSFGVAIMLISLSFQLMAAIMGWMSTLSDLVRLLPYYERMKPLIEQTPEENRSLLEFPLNGAIRIENISFGYPGSSHSVVQSLSFHIPPGQFVALIGPSGGGKSTLLRLILGLEKPTEGDIYIDDVPLSQINLQNFRSQVGVVLQRPSFVPGNILDNLSLFERQVTQEQIWEALDAAEMKADITSLPMGLFTPISELGRTFSSGQMQRLMIARALIRKPKILLFDEPTSALDAISQQKIITTFNKISSTKVIITHRISSIREADIIYIIDKGRIIEHGDFAFLYKKSQVFQKLLDI